MRTINLKEIKIKEVILNPEASHPLSVLFEVLGDDGKAVYHKRVQVKSEDLSPQGINAMNDLLTKLTSRITNLEL